MDGGDPLPDQDAAIVWVLEFLWDDIHMIGLLKAIGHGLLFAGLVLISLYFAALYLRDGAIGGTLDPLAITTYAPLLLLTPGALLLCWATT